MFTNGLSIVTKGTRYMNTPTKESITNNGIVTTSRTTVNNSKAMIDQSKSVGPFEQ